MYSLFKCKNMIHFIFEKKSLRIITNKKLIDWINNIYLKKNLNS